MVTVSRRRASGHAPRPGSVVPLVGPAEADDLATLYDRYRAVSGRLAPDLIATPDMAYARAALIQALIKDGWTAPEIVHERLRADEEVLHPRLVAAS
jgi:hypothetical protein